MGIFFFFLFYVYMHDDRPILTSFRYKSQPGLLPLIPFFPFALSRRSHFATFGPEHPEFWFQLLYYYAYFLHPHSFSAPIQAPFPPLLSYSQPLYFSKTYFSSGPIARFFASKLASHLFSGRACQQMSNFFNSLILFLSSIVNISFICVPPYVCVLRSQHSGVSIAPIPARKVPTAPCPVLSLSNRDAYYFWRFHQRWVYTKFLLVDPLSAVFPLLVFGQSSGKKFVWSGLFQLHFTMSKWVPTITLCSSSLHILRPGRLSRPLLFSNDQEPIEISPHTHFRLVVWLLDRQSLKLRILRFCLRFLPEPPPSL